MNVFSDLTKRLLRIDRSAFAELEMLGKNNPNECFDALWAFVTQVAEEWPHVQSGLVDRAILMMMQLQGRKETESFILNSWEVLREETRGELLYSGIANPEVLSNEFCIELFGRITDVVDKRVIVGSLYSTMYKRNFPRSLLSSMFGNLGRFGDAQRDGELDAYVSERLKELSDDA